MAQQLGALGVIIVDHMEGTSFEVAQSFGMSGDSHSDDVIIPSVFLFRKEGDELRKLMQETEGKLEVRLAEKPVTTGEWRCLLSRIFLALLHTCVFRYFFVNFAIPLHKITLQNTGLHSKENKHVYSALYFPKCFNF